MQNCPVDSAISDEEIEFDQKPRSVAKVTRFGNNRPLQTAPGLKISSLSKVAPVEASAEKPIEGERLRRGGSHNAAPTEILTDYLADYLADGQYHGQSLQTLRGKKDVIEKLLWFLQRGKFTRCGSFEVKRFLSHVQNGHLEADGRYGSRAVRSYQAVGERTVQLYFVYIKGFLTWLFDEELIASNPLLGVKQPKCAKPHVQPLSIEEIGLLLAAIRKVRNHARNEALIYFLLDTGVRVSEMCDIMAGDIDLARGVVTVTGKGRKKRDVWFGRDTAAVLKRYLSKYPRHTDEPLFYSQQTGADGLTPDGVRRLLSRWGTLAGLSEKRVSPHTFRHTFATEFIRAGGAPKALQMLLGHEDMEMTYRYVSFCEADAAAQHRLHSPARLLRVQSRKK